MSAINLPPVNITAADALDQSVVNLAVGGYSYASGLVCKLTSATTFQLYSKDLSQFMTNIPGMPGYFVASYGTPCSFNFATDPYRNIMPPIDLTKTTWAIFTASPIYLIEGGYASIYPYVVNNVFTNSVTMTGDLYGRANASNITQYQTIVSFPSANAKMRAYLGFTTDPAVKAGCCMAAYEGSDDDSKNYKDLCTQATLYSNNNSASPNLLCDAYMNQYCVTTPGAKYCSCYNADAEIAKLPAAMQAYSSILKSNPKCWIPECNVNGYKNVQLREPSTCSITICTQQTDISGDKNILTNSQGQQFCNGGVPIKVPTNPSTSTSGSTTSNASGTTSSINNSTTGQTTPPNNTGSDNVINNDPATDKPDNSTITLFGVKVPWFVFIIILAIVVFALKSSQPQPQAPYYPQYYR